MLHLHKHICNGATQRFTKQTEIIQNKQKILHEWMINMKNYKTTET